MNTQLASATFGRQSLVILVVALIASFGRLESQETFEADFDVPDGPVENWVTATGSWTIEGGALVNSGGGGEEWIWAGDPPLGFSEDLSIDVTVNFDEAPGDAVGRHGGIQFFCSEPTTRATFSGYTLDWIDRVDDFGLRLIRYDAGVPTALQLGTPELFELPTEWNVEVEGDSIFISADGQLVMDIVDGTYRDGLLGAWAWGNGTRMRIDEIAASFMPTPVKACGTATPLSGEVPLVVDFDASCSTSTTEIVRYAWDFGDGTSAVAEVARKSYLFGDTYTAVLTVEDSAGNTSEETFTINAFETADGFVDDFNQADGAPENWTPALGTWEVVDGQLTNFGDGDGWIWAGNTPIRFSGDITATVNFEFDPDASPLPVGRHGGFMFYSTVPTHRNDTATSGYVIDWIDRVDDHGFRFYRVDNGLHTFLVNGTAEIVEPPTEWQIQTEGELIRIFADEDLVVEVLDGTYREGFFGAWTYNTNIMRIDSVEIGFDDIEIAACANVTPDSGAAPLDVDFDGSCSTATAEIVAYRWDFGDGTTGEGAQVSHRYDVADTYTVTLTVEDAAGNTAEATRTVSVFEIIEIYSDDFNRDDGPVDDWTVVAGDWQILDEALVIDTPAAPESWAWAGDPAARFGFVEFVEVEVDFLNQPGDAVGRHGGIFVFAANTAPRFDGNSGYSIDWIDREDDRGYRISVWNDGVETPLVAGTGDDEPGLVWRVEADDTHLRFFADGDLKAEIEEGTYRTGYMGLWSYTNGQRIAYDDFMVNEGDVRPEEFRRGDSDDSGGANITDAIGVLNFLFAGGTEPLCPEAADIDANGAVNISDPIRLLNFLFGGGDGPVGGEDCQPQQGDLPCSYTNCP